MVLKSMALFLCIVVSTELYSQIYMDMAMDTSMHFDEIVDEGEAFFSLYGKGQHTGYKAFKRWEYWMKRCLDGQGQMMSKAKLQGNLEAWMKNERPSKSNINIPDWTELGPMQAGNTTGWSSHLGRLSAVAVNDSDLNHIIVGSPSGGVWKTTNGGQNWLPIFDHQSILDVYSLAISPQNPSVYYAGTWGGGVMKSNDGGQTWHKTIGINNSSRIIDIEISPIDARFCIAINEGGNVFYSQDGGEIWSVSLVHSHTLYDAEFRPGDGNVVYVSGKGAVYKSTDRGWTFREIDDGPWKYTNKKYNPMMLGVTRNDPDYLYVLEADNGGFGALYLSQDSGESYSTRSTDANLNNNLLGYDKNIKGGQAPRDMAIAINPNDKNEVHLGGIMTHRSYDGGVNWVQTSHWVRDDPLPFIHADIDYILYRNGRAFFATDGGLFTTDDRGNSFKDLSTGLGVRQFYRIAVSKDGQVIVGGSQDNGTGILREESGWWDFVGADGMEPIVDKDDHDRIYASIQYGNIYRTSNGGISLDGGFTQTPGFGDWVTPLEQDPIEPNTLYQGKNQLYKTTDGMKTWSVISNFNNHHPADTSMQEIEISPVDNKYIVVGFENQVYKTTNGGLTWQDISPPFSFYNVNYISMHPHDKKRIAMTLSGTDNRVVETIDGGITWSSLMLDLPDIGAESVLYEGGPKNGLYVSMNPGIYYRSTDYPTWISITENLPVVLIAELEMSHCDVYAATYGRGLWKNSIMDNTMLYADLDGDGYGDEATATQYCDAPAWYIRTGGDCDDQDPNVHPNGSEVCNGKDDDCDGLTDGADPDATGSNIWYLDADGDGYGDAAQTKQTCDAPFGYVSNGSDCDDTDANIHPEATEICNEVDDDCNGLTDSSDPNVVVDDLWYLDADGDGYGTEMQMMTACEQPVGYVANGADCNDSDASIYPDATEICNGSDDDCNSLVDDNVIETFDWYLDGDGDGYGNAAQMISACTAPEGYVSDSSDCDDSNPEINPSSAEQCNEIDDDCNGVVDDNVQGTKVWYLDSDGDGYGNAEQTVSACIAPEGYVSDASDCDDANAYVHPTAIEQCNGSDDDCNGEIDDNVTGVIDWYLDTDGDGFGNNSQTVSACEAPDGYVSNNGDCNDNDPNINPNASELCNEMDDDCDGVIDDNTVGEIDWYQDADGDGYGDPSQSVRACISPLGYVADDTDCDDNNPNIHPYKVELCNGIDEDCDGVIDEGCSELEDCDGNFLFIHTSFQDAYHAGQVLFSDAALEGEETQLFAAGSSIELLPGFEVDSGKQFNAIIKPCFNGVSPLNTDMDIELALLDGDINERISEGELIHIRVMNSHTHRIRNVFYSKSDINLKSILDQLPSGQYVIFIDSESLSWNKEFYVIS